MKPYVLLIAISPSYGDVKPGSPLGAFKKSRLIPAAGFPFTLPHLVDHSYITSQNDIYTNALLIPTDTKHYAM